MKVSEVKETINNPKMQNLETNFKLKKPGRGPKKPRKPPKYFTDFANKQEKANKYFTDFANQMLEFVKEQRKNWQEQRKFNNLILNRIDNLVKKNKLKE